ncbi:MAG: DNA repair protein RadA [Microthrixaceae bacterium]
MTRTRSVFRCEHCLAEQPKWAGRCAGCGEWNTLCELTGPELAERNAPVVLEARPAPAITDVLAEGPAVVPTGLGEADRVLGGGLVPGSVTLLGGEPGVGKSTFVLQYLAAQARSGASCSYVTGEESPRQVAGRAERLGALEAGIALYAETSLDSVLAHLGAERPAVCVVDSVQTLHDPSSTGTAGSVTQVRDCAQRLVTAAKTLGITMVLVGHVTKEGTLAGPRVLEHVVDTVLTMEGDRHGELRMLRALKHRFGSTQEVGILALGESGFTSVADPSAMFLADRRPGIPGSVVVPALEGRRPLLVEVQALVTRSQLPQPRRSAQGMDAGRLGMLLAVLARRLDVSTSGFDVYAMAVGGVRVTEPGVDLAISAAVASSVTNRAAVDGLVLFGEVGLGGELRSVARMGQRLTEAARHGFEVAIVPRSAPSQHPGIEVIAVPTLDAALTVAGVV